MNKHDLLKKAVGAAGKVVDFTLEHRKLAVELLTHNFTGEVTEHLRDKRITIPESAILPELKKLEKDEKWTVQSVKCFPDRMEIIVSGDMFSVNATMQVAFRIQSMTINEQKQQIVFSILQEKLTGNNILGRIVCSLASCLSGNFCQKAIDLSAWKDRVAFSDDNKMVTVELSGVSAVEKMRSQQIPGWEDSVPLRLVGIQNAVHEEGGIVLILTVAKNVERLGEAAGTLQEGVRKALQK